MDSEIAACPFCGDKARAWEPTAKKSDPKELGGRFYPVVRCMGCGAEVSGADHDWKCESAVRAWNRRAPHRPASTA